MSADNFLGLACHTTVLFKIIHLNNVVNSHGKKLCFDNIMINMRLLDWSYFYCYLLVLIRLKQFYANSSNLQYFKNLIRVPSLPDVRIMSFTLATVLSTGS